MQIWSWGFLKNGINESSCVYGRKSEEDVEHVILSSSSHLSAHLQASWSVRPVKLGLRANRSLINDYWRRRNVLKVLQRFLQTFQANPEKYSLNVIGMRKHLPTTNLCWSDTGSHDAGSHDAGSHVSWWYSCFADVSQMRVVLVEMVSSGAWVQTCWFLLPDVLSWPLTRAEDLTFSRWNTRLESDGVSAGFRQGRVVYLDVISFVSEGRKIPAICPVGFLFLLLSTHFLLLSSHSPLYPSIHLFPSFLPPGLSCSSGSDVFIFITADRNF